MKTAVFVTLAFAACASIALADPLPPVAGANDRTAAEARSPGPIALTEAEMDKVTAGYGSIFSYQLVRYRTGTEVKFVGEALDAITDIITEQ